MAYANDLLSWGFDIEVAYLAGLSYLLVYDVEVYSSRVHIECDSFVKDFGLVRYDVALALVGLDKVPHHGATFDCEFLIFRSHKEVNCVPFVSLELEEIVLVRRTKEGLDLFSGEVLGMFGFKVLVLLARDVVEEFSSIVFTKRLIENRYWLALCHGTSHKAASLPVVERDEHLTRLREGL